MLPSDHKCGGEVLANCYVTVSGLWDHGVSKAPSGPVFNLLAPEFYI
jgi:hypothetical protein